MSGQIIMGLDFRVVLRQRVLEYLMESHDVGKTLTLICKEMPEGNVTEVGAALRELEKMGEAWHDKLGFPEKWYISDAARMRLL